MPEIKKIGDTFTLDGVRYVALNLEVEDQSASCQGCVADDNDDLCLDLPDCLFDDGRECIFKVYNG